MVRLKFTPVVTALSGALLGGLFTPVPALAQAPNVGFPFPPGGQLGTKATVNLNGANLQGATAVLVSGEGVQAQITNATNAAALPVELTIAPNAKPGLREMRVITPRGASNGAHVWVGGYPEGNEVEPNNNLAAAQKVEKLPLTLNGQVNGSEDVDCFTFQAAAGETFVFDLIASQIASGLDGYLALYDARGKVLQSAMDSFDRDPRIVYTFKNAGTYTIQVRDSMYRGGGNFVYRLTAGKIPVITGFLPRAGKKGQTVNVTMEGANLGEMKSMAVQIPADGGDVTLVPATPGGMPVNGLSLMASDLHEMVETEPNDEAGQAMPLPDGALAVSGRMDKGGDVDVYRIKPAAAGTLAIDLFGRQIGSRIDSYLRVLDPMGKELQANDDSIGKDSRIVFGVAAGTEYLVEVRSQDQRFGGDVYYRLQIAPPGAQDFKLTVTPDEINVGQGGSTLVTVGVQRLNGFGGPVALKLEGLPAGMTVSPAFVPAGGGSALFTLTADPAAVQGAYGIIRVVGTATIGDKPVERVAVPFETYKPPLSADNQTANRNMWILPAAVMPPTPYALTLDKRDITVKRGTDAAVKVTSIRQMGQVAQITLTVAGQPANVAPTLANIAANMNEATLTFKVAANAPVGTYNIIISGNLANNVQVAPAYTVTITE